MTQNIQALKEEASGKLSSIPSLSNLYNSTSQSGSSTTLNTSHSGILNNGGTGIVQKGTIAHINNHQKITNPYGSTTSMSNMSTHSNNTTNTNHSGSNLRHNHDDDDEEDSAFELNWKPQVSSDNHTSGYYDKVE